MTVADQATIRPRVSFEFFPPKTEEMNETLWRSIRRLEAVRPQFVSVTYGAGGSTRARTHAVLQRLVAETELTAAAHLTCVDATRSEVDAVARDYWGAGVRHIVALRGDPAGGAGSAYAPHPEGYENAAALITGLKRIGDFEITVAAYPERHPESGDWGTDIDHLKRKVDAGATRAITQFFFDNDLYEAYVERVRAAGIDIPILPGIAPVLNFKQTKAFAGRCGATVPEWLEARFAGLEDDPETRRLVAAAIAAEQVNDLLERGVGELHFYTMNRALLTYAICQLIGLTPAAREAERAAA